MKRIWMILTLVFSVAALAGGNLNDELHAQLAKVQQDHPGAYLFEATARLSDVGKPIVPVQGRFALPGDKLYYYSVWTTLTPGFEFQNPVREPYLPVMSGVPGHHPKPLPESPAIHRPVTGLNVTLEQMASLIDASWQDPVATVTTLGRLRGTSTLIDLRPLARLPDNKAVVIISETVRILETARYLVLDAGTGDVLSSGTYVVPKPPPPPPGNVSSGG